MWKNLGLTGKIIVAMVLGIALGLFIGGVSKSMLIKT